MISVALASLVASAIGAAYKVYQTERGRARMSKSEKEKMDYQDTIEDENAEDAFARQVEFQNEFLTPEAQLTSLARGYDKLGLNRMGLVGAQPGATASSAPQSSTSMPSSPEMGGFGDIAGLLSSAIDADKVQKSYEISREQNRINKFNAETERIRADADARYKDSLLAGQNITNDWLNQIYGAEVASKNADANARNAQAAQLRSLVQTEFFQRQLLRKNIQIADVDLAIKEYQKAITAAVSNNADAYYRAQAKLATSSAMLQSDTSYVFHSLLQKRVAAARAELNSIIIDAGMKAKVFSGSAFAAEVEGGLTKGEKQKMWLDFGGSVLNCAIGVAGGAAISGMLGAGSAAGSLSNILLPKQGYFTAADLGNLTGNQPYR